EPAGIAPRGAGGDAGAIEHRDLDTLLLQVPCGGEADHARADDDRVRHCNLRIDSTSQDARACPRPKMPYAEAVLLSDRDIKAELASGRIGLDPHEPEMIQPSSIDVRLDRYFRLFDNHKYPFIDPSEDQPELTRL